MIYMEASKGAPIEACQNKWPNFTINKGCAGARFLNKLKPQIYKFFVTLEEGQDHTYNKN